MSRAAALGCLQMVVVTYVLWYRSEHRYRCAITGEYEYRSPEVGQNRIAVQKDIMVKNQLPLIWSADSVIATKSLGTYTVSLPW